MEEEWTDPEKGAVPLVTMGAMGALWCWFLPYISFDPAPLGAEHRYPHGESMALVDPGMKYAALILMMCPLFAWVSVLRLDLRWPYWATWILVVLAAAPPIGCDLHGGADNDWRKLAQVMEELGAKKMTVNTVWYLNTALRPKRISGRIIRLLGKETHPPLPSLLLS